MQAPIILPRQKAQRGGTFLGIIIGVLVGLGAALAVAVYVTKVPVPFMNKGIIGKSSADQDAAEAQKNKNWDPNAPLYGKNAGKSSVSGSVGTATSTVSSTAPLPASAASAPKSAASAAKASSNDSLGDLAKARTTPTGTATAVVGVDPFTYFVQVGAFRTAEDADAQKVKLALAGFEAKITEREQSGRTVFRVRIGPVDKKEDADKAKERLDAAGYESAIVRVQR